MGRFAPTPSGPLHLGSLVAALASFLDARARGGQWLLRIDDLDQPRVRPGCEAAILRQLESLGLRWNGPVDRQSSRQADYARALDALRQRAHLFHCDCTRQQLRAANAALPPDDAEPNCAGDCRRRPVSPGSALRLDLTPHLPTGFEDRWQGWVPTSATGLRDRVVLRRDGIIAYHLAVVVDDLASGVTDVVRGADLLASTPAQIAIYRALGAPAPRYAHAPVVTEPDGRKLAKSRHSVAVGSPDHARRDLLQALRLLRQDTLRELDQFQVGAILDHAVRHWQPERLRGLRTVPAPAQTSD